MQVAAVPHRDAVAGGQAGAAASQAHQITAFGGGGAAAAANRLNHHGRRVEACGDDLGAVAHLDRAGGGVAAVGPAEYKVGPFGDARKAAAAADALHEHAGAVAPCGGDLAVAAGHLDVGSRAVAAANGGSPEGGVAVHIRQPAATSTDALHQQGW